MTTTQASGENRPSAAKAMQLGPVASDPSMVHQDPDGNPIYIEHLEDLLWRYFTAGDIRRIDEATATLFTQDLGPLLADFLHAHGVIVNWFDGSYRPETVAAFFATDSSSRHQPAAERKSR